MVSLARRGHARVGLVAGQSLSSTRTSRKKDAKETEPNNTQGQGLRII